MQKKEFIYEGKAKQVYSTDDENLVIIHYKDDATAFNGVKKDTINNKGIINNKITELLFSYLAKNGIPTHFIKRLNERDQLCQKVNIIPLEVIVRNVIAGSMAKRLAISEGTVAKKTIFEMSYKNDELGDPLINDDHALALGLVSCAELEQIRKLTLEINELLKKIFIEEKIILVDFKIEFGKNHLNQIVLADEISPDTCRLWDANTNEKLDKDRFRRDLGSVEAAYLEILERLS
ncbi:MAG: phosphoribosylaminoimidazolesuccinocarboxamide synthase [Erysipelotrichaceae bacterium]